MSAEAFTLAPRVPCDELTPVPRLPQPAPMTCGLRGLSLAAFTRCQAGCLEVRGERPGVKAPLIRAGGHGLGRRWRI